MQRAWRQTADRWWLSLPYAIGLELRPAGSGGRVIGTFVLYRDGREVSRHKTLIAAQNATEELTGRATRIGYDNPGRRLPAITDRCVAHVAPRLKSRGKRGALSGAIAICTAAAQKRGAMRKGTRTLTAKGRREERSAVRRKGYREDVREVKRLSRAARKNPPRDRLGRFKRRR